MKYCSYAGVLCIIQTICFSYDTISYKTLTNGELFVKFVFHVISSMKDTLIEKGEMSEATAKKDKIPQKI